jgi:hypothetical protein
MNGCTGTSGAIMTPPSPARQVPMMKVPAASQRTEMPCACASSGLLTMARMRLPVRLCPYQTTSAPTTPSEMAISNRR